MSDPEVIIDNIAVPADRVLRKVLKAIIPDEDWDDDHHRDTPRRFIRMLQELTAANPDAFNFTTFPSKANEMVVVQDIKFVSLCAHHMLPFVGKAHIAYIPDALIAGLSKFARTVQYMSKGLWVQEELTEEICNFLEENLQPKGVAIIIAARHSCMEIRGAQAEGAITTTSAIRGVFRDEERGARQEFLGLLRNRNNLA